MNRRIASLMVGIVVSAVFASNAVGQAAGVGYPPTQSPYVDLEHSQELTLFGGWFHAHRDPADVGPESGPVVGAHYEWRAGGPAHLVAEVARMQSDRNMINPFAIGAARELGKVSRPLYTADFDLGLSLTGGKSWHHLVPEIETGVGFISDLRVEPDTGGFRFGTRFAFNGGAGLRYVPGGGSRWQVRGDIKDRLYTLAYPQTFYIAPTGGTAVVPTTQAKSFWTNNPTFTLGLSYLF
ncbi:MAG TPA: hypothetical protein VH277_08880 [Gemmatimonadaceae bacterium]|nr:hypothetical protein [Gemmatimonadaceae bacterium]